MAATFNVSKVGTNIKIDNGVQPEYIKAADIENISGIFIDKSTAYGGPSAFGTGYPDIYPYKTKTEVIITFIGSDNEKNTLRFDLQKITAGDLVTYNTGTQANLNSALALIATW